MINTYIPGTTVFFPFDPKDLDISSVSRIIFAFADNTRKCVVTKEYPKDTTTTADGIILVPLTQEDTAAMPAGGIAQAQINYNDMSVTKTLETILRYHPTINTEFIDGNHPSVGVFSEINWKELDFASQIIQVNMTVSGVPDGSVTEAKLAPAVKQQLAEVPVLKQDLDKLKEDGGVTAEMAESLWVFLQKSAYAFGITAAERTAFKQAWKIQSADIDIPEEPDEPPTDEPTEKTLVSITVNWDADSSNVGVDPSTLIASVTASYSDGSSESVTNYTVVPAALVEGEQTVTVTYKGKTATKTITGNAIVQEGPKYQLEQCENVPAHDRYNSEKVALLSVDGNTISWTAGANGGGPNWYFNINLSSALSNGANSMPTDTWFTLPSGSTIELKGSVADWANAGWSKTDNIALRNASTTILNLSNLDFSGQQKNSFSITMTIEEDTPVTHIMSSLANSTSSIRKISIELYVNGERWI